MNKLAGRSATPEDVARPILALTANTYVAGEITVIDGGPTLVM